MTPFAPDPLASPPPLLMRTAKAPSEGIGPFVADTDREAMEGLSARRLRPAIRILGTRGVPAAHGGFETFAERLALYLVERGWSVTVYCQIDGRGAISIDRWRGVERVLVPIDLIGAKSTILFDWKSILHAASAGEPCLTLGYNTALFCTWLRWRGVQNVINMDGIEWARVKWSPIARAWLWINDHAGCRLGNHLVADHPAIAEHLATRVGTSKITTIPYGADEIEEAPIEPVVERGLVPGQYLTLVARPEPENSVLEVVRAFSRKPRGVRLAVLGTYKANIGYHDAVRAAAGPEVDFIGAVYAPAIVQALRFHSLAYVHGHQVGGTNPSLVEALGAGNAVLAHDNRFNRWVAGDAARYFSDEDAFERALEHLLAHPSTRAEMSTAARLRVHTTFRWSDVLHRYEALLLPLTGARRLDQDSAESGVGRPTAR